MRARIVRALTDRPIADRDVLYSLNREVVPILRDLLRQLTAAPVSFTWDEGEASIDVSQGNTFAAAGELTEDSELILENGADGCEGTFVVCQDTTGGWALELSAEGRTIARPDPIADDDPDPSPNSLTMYRYLYLTVNGEALVIVSRTTVV